MEIGDSADSIRLGYLLEKILGILIESLWFRALCVLGCCWGFELEMWIWNFLFGWVGLVIGGSDFGVW